jgi:parallel beta-helix repeat protein
VDTQADARSASSRPWCIAALLPGPGTRAMIVWMRCLTAGRTVIRILVLCCLLILVEAPMFDAHGSFCPGHAIDVQPGASIQAAVDFAGAGATFCLKQGIHRGQSVRPRPRQRFYGERQTNLNGSREIHGFSWEDPYWTMTTQLPRAPTHGECLPTAPACDQPEALFMDDKPLTKVLSKDALRKGKFYIDDDHGKIYLLDDPTNRKVEVTVASFAFESAADNVWISNVIVEKFASVAQKGAIHAGAGARWVIENCEVRLNSGAGIGVGTGSRVHGCNVHHNGQIGIAGNGKDIRIAGNRIWSNNIHGFDPAWEAGGVKLGKSDGVLFRANHVHDNRGLGLWCDIDCRNVIYEENVVENNQYSGIFHEISFNAVIRNNTVRTNGKGDRGWFWGADITIAASQDVEVTGNIVTVAEGGCGIMLIDQGRDNGAGKKYRTRNNTVRANEMTFEGAACAGGVSDTKPDDENFTIITDGNNWFDGNTYRVAQPEKPARFVWGRDVTDWAGFRRKGLERSGRLVPF